MKVELAPEKEEAQIVVAKGLGYAVKSVSTTIAWQEGLKKTNILKVVGNMLDDLGIKD